jgi:hypothetical protein
VNVFYFLLQLKTETFILQGTCFIFLCNFCPKHSFYRERVLFSSATNDRNIHSTVNVFYFLLQLLSETFILQGTCFVFLCNFCPKHSLYRERVLFSSVTSVRNILSTGKYFIFPLQLLSKTFIVKGTCFISVHNFCPKHSFYRERVLFFLQLMSAVLFTTVHIKELLSGFAPKIVQVLV